MNEHWCGCECILQVKEGLLTIIGEVPRNSFLGEMSERDHDVQVALDEPAVKIGEAKEGLNVLDFLQLGPIENCLDFVAGHREPRWGEDVSKVFNSLQVPFTFLRLEAKSVGMEMSEDILDVLVMRGKVRGVDEGVVKVDHNAHIQHVSKDAIDKVLERGGSVSETKRHYQPLKGAIVGAEGGLPFISVGNVDQMIRMPEIELGVDLSSA